MPHVRSKETEMKLQNIQRGIAKVLAGGKTMAFRGHILDETTLGPLAAQALAPFEAVHTRKAGYTQALDTRDTEAPGAAKLVEEFQKGAESTWGVGSPECMELGFVPRKANTPLTADQKAQRVERLRATRKARRTMGTRQ